MRLSFNSAVPVDYTEVGYGQAASNIYRSLLTLGYQATLDNALAPVQINFMQPHLYRANFKAYNVLYFPWESTDFRTGWVDVCNQSSIDEIWTVSNWSAYWYEQIGITKPIKVYPHGINAVWKPKLRKRQGPLRYLIVDAEANRKGWQESFEAFREVFKDDPSKATLTIKTRQRCMARWKDGIGRFRNPADLPNVSTNISRLSNEEMVQLFHDHDVLLYASAGEGWGLIPFQMLATGGIAITTEEWCHYKDYLGNFGLRSTYGRTRWEGEHPGDVCYIDQKHLVELVSKSYEDFEEESKNQFKKSFELHKEYDWIELTKEAFSGIVDRANLKFDAR